ncbi:hypothetical protein [Methylobacterium sp. J-076]|uniref:hypothetical protein n=1 Tax=Methylobacterium sp. J-076 TaxID=2836655 RepID=UPI001FBBA790|nr:hypothetical protein [Methylobacterium sp. J-076]MCJ2015543.1 hypothetical protein [Methylobacterium sp. J-076]
MDASTVIVILSFLAALVLLAFMGGPAEHPVMLLDAQVSIANTLKGWHTGVSAGVDMIMRQFLAQQ